MLPRFSPRRFLAVASALLLSVRLGAQLSSSSPFLPPAAAAGGPTQNAPVEFRGMIETTDGVQYRIADPARKNGGGVWVKMNERNPELGVTVKQYNPDKETVVVDHEGRTLTLELRKSKIISTGPAAQVMVPPVANAGAPATNMLPAVTQSVVPNPTQQDEQKRLEAVAQEVARRRALREQASTQMNNPTPGQPVATPAPVVPQVAPAVIPNNPAPAQGGRRTPPSNTRQQ